MTPVSYPARRLAAAAGLLSIVLLSCGKDVTAPVSQPQNAFRRFGAIAFNAEYETALKGPELRAALTQVAFEKVRVTLRREDGSIVLDTVVTFPAGADQMTLSLTIPLPPGVPSTGVPLSLGLSYVNAAGDTVFKGTAPVTVVPSATGSPAPPAVQVPVVYSGTGANAAGVMIAPKIVNGVAGQSTTLTSNALTATGAPIAGTPIAFSSSNPAVVTVPSATSPTINFVGRGTAKVYAELLTGPKDSATVTVTLPAARLNAVSGDGQNAFVNEQLTQRIVVRVTASDGVGVGNVRVSFVPQGGGTIDTPDVLTVADGTASARWTLGSTVGAQQLTVFSSGLANSPLTFDATARASVPTRLVMSIQPQSTEAGRPMAPVSVLALDDLGNLVTSYTGLVTVAINNNPGGGMLAGTMTVAAVGGTATFSGLTISKPGSGYALRFGANELAGAVSRAFDILPGSASRLAFTGMPASGDAASALASIVVTAQDEGGNTVAGFAGDVTISISPATFATAVSGTLTRRAAAGVATFSDIRVSRPGTVSFSAAATGLTPASSTPLTIVAGPPASLTLERGGLQTKAVGTTLDSIVVKVTDASGNPIAGREVTFAVTSGGGTLAPTTANTDANGRAWTWWTIGSGAQKMTASVTGLPPLEVTATGTAGAPTQLKIVTAPAASWTAGVSSPTFSVEVLDARNNRVSTYNTPVVLTTASGPTGALLFGATTVTPVNGIASFREITAQKAGAYTFKLASGDLPALTTSAVTVVAGPAAKVVADSGLALSGVVGSPLASPFVVYVTDAYDNPVSGANVTWAVTGGSGSLAGGGAAVSSVTNSTDLNGRTRVTLSLGPVVGPNTVTATGAGVSGPPVTFTASGLAAGAAQLVVTTQPPTSGTAGAPLSPAVVVAVKDASGNAVTSFTSGLKATIASGPAGATIVGVDSVQAAAGIATFSSLGFDKAGTYTVRFASSGLTSATTNSFTIVAGAAKNIAADSGGAQSTGIGTALAAPLVVRVTDLYGNPVGGTAITWAVTAGGGSVDSTSTVTNAQGRTRARLTVGNTAGTNNNTVTASGSGLTGSPVTFSASATAGAATQLVFTTGPATTTAGVPMAPIVVTAKDASGNVATGFTGGVSIDISPNANGAIIWSGTTGVGAVAGVATFTSPGIAIRKAGTGYTFKAMATGFTAVTSGTFDITPAPAFEITADSGGAQSAIAGTALLNKFVVLVRDSVGNPVSGTGVTWAVASGGGSLDSTSTVTNAAGRTRARLTLGSTAGANTVTASSGTLSGSPITFSATGTSGAVAQLVITAQPSNIVAGVPFSPAVVVEARDAGGNLNTAFTDNVTAVLVNNPTSATLGGTTSVAAVGGVATFSNFGLGKVGTGYTVGFSSGALNSTASSAFNVTPSTAWNTVADSGLAQTGPAGQPLGQPLVVAVTDSFGNPIAGRTVTWVVKTGGGALDSTTTITNANGRTRSKWTLGLTVGAQQVVAKAGLADSAIFGATGQSVMFNKVWKGFTNTQWATASNWSPGGVPAATDSVGIDSVANQPVLSSPVTVARLGAMPGVILALGANDLTVNGIVDIGARASITATTGRLVLAGTSSTVVGPSFPDVRITGTYVLNGATTFTDSVTVETGGQFDAGNHAATINGALTTTGTGTFLISGAGGSIGTGGNVTLSGGNVALNNGELRVGGNFNQTAGTFQQNASTTKFVGATAHSLSVSDTSSTTYFGTIGNSGTGDITLMTPLRAKGPVKADVGAGRWLGANKAARAYGVVVDDSTQFAVDTLHVWQGTGMQLSSKLVTTVVVTGNPVSAATSFVLHGNLIVGDGGNFQVNSQFIRLSSFATTGTGQLTMSGSDSLEVLGNATFGGGVTAGTLSGGGMTVGGNFAQLNNSQSFKAGPVHRTWLAGNSNQTISFANPDSGSNPGCASSCFGQLRSSKTAGIVTFLSSAKADSSMLLTGPDSVLAPTFTLQARGDFNANNRVDGTVRARYVKYAGAIYRTGGTFAVDTLITFGPNAVLMGSESKPVIVQGPVAMPDYRMYEAVIIDGPNGILTTSGSDTVAALGARNGGRLKMITANDTLRVTGKVFMSGAGAHQLTAGTLILSDSVGMAGAAFTPDSAHTTVFERGTGTQQITINGLALGRIIFRGGAKKQFTSSPGNLAANGSIYVASGSDSITSATGFTLEARKSVFDSAYVLAPYQLAVSGEVTAKLPARIVAPTFAVWSDRTLQDTLYVVNSMYVGNSPAVLELNGKRLRVGLGFSTQGSGRLKMVNAADSLITAGGAPIFFNGANTESLLTDGTIVAGGNFSQGGSDSKAFVAGPNHTVKFTGTGVKTITLAHSAPGQTRFGKLVHDMTDTLYLKNDVRAYSFATGAGATHPLRVGSGANPAFPSLIVQGADIDGAAFNGTHFQLLDSLAVAKLANVSFVNSDPAGVPLIVKRTGSAGPPAGSIPALTGTWSFGTTPSTGHYLDAEDTDGSSPDVLHLNFTGTVSPGSHGGKLGLANGATTSWTNTPTALWTGATSTAWATATNWAGNTLPTTTDSVHIPSGTPNIPALSVNTTVRSITVATGARLDIGTFSLDVTERASADTAASGGFACAGGRVRMVTGAGTGAVKGRFCKLEIQTNRATAGPTVVSDTLLVSAGDFSTGADSLVTYHLDVIGSGALVMGATANVTVLGNARFAGAATNTKLTGGVMRVAGDLAQAGSSTSLQPGSNHRVVLNGSGTQTVSFANPDSVAFVGAFGAHFGSLSVKKTGGRVTFPDGMKARGRVAIDSVGIDSVDVRNNRRFIVEGDSLIAARLRAPRVAINGGFKRDSASVLDSLLLYGTGHAMLPGSAANLRIDGSAVAATNGSLYGVRIANSGTLEIATRKLTVARFVKEQGQLKMLADGDTLFITDSAAFATTGDSSFIKGGVIWHTGRYFESRNDGFQSTGSNVLVFARAAADSQRVYGDSFTSYIGANRIYFTGSSPKKIEGIVVSNSTVHIGASSGTLVCPYVGCNAKLRLPGSLVDSTAAGTAFRVGAWVTGRPAVFPRKIFTDLYITDSMTVYTDSLIVQNDLSVEGANAWLNLNGRPTVAGSRFITGSGGRFVMQNASDALRAGTMQLAGGSTTGLLTNGLLAFTYHFLQSGSPTSFAPSGNFVARFDTAAYVGTPEFRFENPTTSRFNTLVLANRTMSMALGRDLEVDSLVFADSLVERVFQSIDANRRTFTVRSIRADSMVVGSGVRLRLAGSGPIQKLRRARFDNPVTDTALIVERAGGSINTLSQITFLNAPTSGAYLRAVDTNVSDNDTLVVNFTGVSPVGHGGKIGLIGGAKTNWQPGLALSATASGDWSSTSTWSPAVVPTANDDVTIGSGITVQLASAPGAVRHVTLSGGTIDLTNQTLQVNGNISAAGAEMTGTGTVRMTGGKPHTVTIDTVPNLQVDANSLTTLGGNLLVSGDATLIGTLLVNGQRFEVDGLLNVPSGGGLKMVNAADSVDVYDATFSGVPSDTLLTNGKLVVGNNFTQSGNSLSFAPTGSHVTYLGGDGTGAASLRAERMRALTESATLSNRRNNVQTWNRVQFANPGWSASRFNTLRFDHTNDASVAFATDVYATSVQTVGMTSMRTVFADNPVKLYVKNVDLRKLYFNRVALQLDAGGVFTRLDTLTFLNQSGAANQLTLDVPAAANWTLRALSFESMPTTGKYLVTNVAGASTITLENPNPGTHGGFFVPPGLLTQNWASTQSYTSASGGIWSTPGTWSPVGVPSRHDDVTITGGTVQLSADAGVRNISLNPGAGLDLQSSALRITGNYFTDTTATVTASASTGKTFHNGAGTTIRGHLKFADITSSVSLAGWVKAAATLRVVGTGASLDVGANNLQVDGEFWTMDGGTLKMGNAASKVTIAQNAWFEGGSTTGLINNGVLVARQNFDVDDNAFDATGAHITEIAGTPGQDISWSVTGTQGSFNHLTFRNSGIKTINSDIKVGGTLTIASDVANDITGAGQVYWSGGTMRDSATSTNGRWAVTTTRLNGTVTTMPVKLSTLLKVNGSLTLTDSLRVSGGMEVAGSLDLNGRRLQVSSLDVNGAGLVKMTNAADTLLVNGLASWHGAVPNITNGVTVFNGSFSQAPGFGAATNTFNPSGSHKTLMQRVSAIDSTVTFANPTSSYFNDLYVASNLQIVSDVTVKGTLSRDMAPQQRTISSTTQQLLVTSGIIGDGLYPLGFNGARLRFIDGTSNTVVQNLNFSGFSAFTGVVFEVMRSTPATLALTNINFNSITLSGPGQYIKNNGSIQLSPLTGNTCTLTLNPGLSCP